MIEISILEHAGDFAENKDTARDLRVKMILPALQSGEDVILNFAGVRGATQSFVHALISDAIRKFGGEILDKIQFKSCNDTVQKIIEIVVGYMQDGAEV